MNQRKRHHLNVAGDFYVEDRCCAACGLPDASAPGMFGWADDDHCFVKKQPANAEEREQMLNALHHTEAQCIRYAGFDPKVVERITELGDGKLCDVVARSETPEFPYDLPLCRSSYKQT